MTLDLKIQAKIKEAEYYFETSFCFNFVKKTKEEESKIKECMDLLHTCRLIYDKEYEIYFKNKKK